MIIHILGGYSTELPESGFQPTTALKLISPRLLMAPTLPDSLGTLLTQFKPLIRICCSLAPCVTHLGLSSPAGSPWGPAPHLLPFHDCACSQGDFIRPTGKGEAGQDQGITSQDGRFGTISYWKREHTVGCEDCIEGVSAQMGLLCQHDGCVGLRLRHTCAQLYWHFPPSSLSCCYPMG
nr:uncharacterized protein LOC116281044 isoform X3 [Vicugna pacos]XP_031535309.1 uncharacterized protein LOC116281044 isoform X3 [Vicugna pacos]XP_031535310.1 uncharacterized protein LOC116281044 isoform X3 [Vicugna pacos]